MMKKILWSVLILMVCCIGLSDAETWVAPDQKEARKRAREVVPFVEKVKEEGMMERRLSLMEKGVSMDDVKEVYFLLDSPIIKKREDHYGPVRFAHKRHAALVNDCSKCHHLRPEKADAKETTRCSACHQESFKQDFPERMGLKAAYHQQCIGCHQEETKGPVSCTGCHLNNVPDHKELVKLGKDPEPTEVTTECLRCHEEQGKEFLSTAHWLWKGPSPYTTGERKKILHGKGTTALNNY